MNIGAVFVGFLLTVAGIVGMTVFFPIVDYRVTLAFYGPGALANDAPSAHGTQLLLYVCSVMSLVFGIISTYYGMNVEDNQQ
jgi:hypothetical protein